MKKQFSIFTLPSILIFRLMKQGKGVSIMLFKIGNSRDVEMVNYAVLSPYDGSLMKVWFK